MKFTAALKYQLDGFKKPVIIYYIIMYSLVVLATVTELFLPHVDMRGSTSGFEVATIIFLFVCCLNSFKTSFKMLLANGVSRLTMFKSYITTLGAAVLAVTIIDSISALVFSAVTNYHSLFYSVFDVRYVSVPEFSLQVIGEGFIWRLFTYAAFAITGFFITTLYYRINKPLKLTVSIGAPVFFLIILPTIDNRFFDGSIYRTIISYSIYGFSTPPVRDPYLSALFSAVIFIVFGVLSFLLVRRATIKE